MGFLQHQIPVHSPLSLGDWTRTSLGVLGPDRRPDLAERLACRFRAADVLLRDSGTHALQEALEWALQQRPGAILAPAYVCYDVATALLGTSGRVLLYDVDPDTLAPDMESLRQGLLDGASAVVVCPLYGMAFPLKPIVEEAAKAGAVVIEDAAQGHGARTQEGLSGSVGDLSILSFGRGKGWTGGGGGALLFRGPAAAVRSPEVAPPPRTAVLAAKALAQWMLARPNLYRIPSSLPWLGLGETHYHPPSPVREMAPWSAALVLAGEDRSETEARIRHRLGDRLVRALHEMENPGLRPVTASPGVRPGFLRVPVRVQGGLPALGADARRLGMAPGYPRPLSELDPLLPRIENPRQPFPGAQELARTLVTLPCHSRVGEGHERALLSRLMDYCRQDRTPRPPHAPPP